LWGPVGQSSRKEQTLFTEAAHGRRCRAGAAEGLEESAHGGLDLLVGVEDDTARGVGNKTHRQPHLEFAPTCLGPLAAEQACAQHVELGLAHGALESEQQAVIEMRRVVEAVLIEDERVGQRTDLEQTVPVGRAAC